MNSSRFIATVLFITTIVLISSYHISLPRRSAVITTNIPKKKLNFLNSESRNSVNKRITGRKRISSFASIQPSFDSSRYSVTFPSGSFENIATLYTRCSWISWWIQIILSVVAGVILTFANSVRQSSEKGAYFLWTSGFVFSTTGVLISLVSSIWTWNMTRLKRRLSLNKIKENAILPTLKRSSKISVVLSLVGMFVTLLGAEQIVGTLASKVSSVLNILVVHFKCLTATQTKQRIGTSKPRFLSTRLVSFAARGISSIGYFLGSSEH